MNCVSIKDIFLKEVDNTSLITSIVGCWRKYEKLGEESGRYIEVDIIEFNADGTGVLTYLNDVVFFTFIEDKFNYRVQGSKIIFSYASFPEKYDILDYRVANGHLILIDDYGMPCETMEVYSPFSPHKSKQRKLKN